jgi:endoglucanase
MTTAGLASDSAATAASVASLAPQLHVSGNRLVNAYGRRVVLHGVDRSGAEYKCVLRNGIFDGPHNQGSITAMRKWHINAVRVPLNEACWNGQSYVGAAYRGVHYRKAIEAYVRLLNANGIVAILDLHWSDGLYTGPSAGCASAEAVCQKPMPDAAESIRFWSSVASTFAGNDAVIFDLFNEPYPESALATETAAWTCWLHGGRACSPGISYPVAGMQALVKAVRAAGANNVIMLGGRPGVRQRPVRVAAIQTGRSTSRLGRFLALLSRRTLRYPIVLDQPNIARNRQSSCHRQRDRRG